MALEIALTELYVLECARQEAATQSDARRFTAEELGIVRQKCATLSGFVREAWPILEPSQPLLWGWHIEAICDHLEAVTAGKIKYLLINTPSFRGPTPATR